MYNSAPTERLSAVLYRMSLLKVFFPLTEGGGGGEGRDQAPTGTPISKLGPGIPAGGNAICVVLAAVTISIAEMP